MIGGSVALSHGHVCRHATEMLGVIRSWTKPSNRTPLGSAQGSIQVASRGVVAVMGDRCAPLWLWSLFPI